MVKCIFKDNFIQLKDNLMTIFSSSWIKFREFNKFLCNLFDEGRETNVLWSMRILSGIVKYIFQRYFSFTVKQVVGAHVGTSVYLFSRSTDSLCFIKQNNWTYRSVLINGLPACSFIDGLSDLRTFVPDVASEREQNNWRLRQRLLFIFVRIQWCGAVLRLNVRTQFIRSTFRFCRRLENTPLVL